MNGSFSSLAKFPYMQVLMVTQLTMHEISSTTRPESSILMYSPMKTPGAWDIDLPVAPVLSPQFRKTTRIPLISFSFPAPYPRSSLQAISWGSHKTHFICFPSFWEHCHSLSRVHWLEKTLFLVFAHFFQLFKWGDKFGPCSSIQVEVLHAPWFYPAISLSLYIFYSTDLIVFAKTTKK